MCLNSGQNYMTCLKSIKIFTFIMFSLMGSAALQPCAFGSGSVSPLDRLEAGVTAQEGIRAVKRLQYTYGYCLDMGLWNDLSDLFSDSAVGRFGSVTVNGRKAIRDHFMAGAGRSAPGLSEGQLNIHLLMQPVITLGPDGRTARGTWHEMAMLGRFGVSASWRGGVYENEYVFEDGVWKISRLNFIKQYEGEYDAPGHRAPSAWNIPYHFKAEHAGRTIPAAAVEALSTESGSIPDGDRLPLIEKRVRTLTDETEVRNLQHIFGYYMDRKMWDDAADLFSDKGTLESGHRGIYRGKARIRKALEVFYGPSPLGRGELFDHINLATVVTAAPGGTRAWARTRQLCMLGVNGEYGRWEAGIYENEFIKEEGVWKIKALHYFPEMITDYDEGWAGNAMKAPVPDRDYPPDHRPSDSYDIYPELLYVAFHYSNPVTGRDFQYPEGKITGAGNVLKPEASSPVISSTKGVPELKTLERGLNAAVAADAVENLNSSYGYFIDESDWDSMADTYAAAGSKEITGAGVYVGRERIRKILKLRGPLGGRIPGFYTIHQLIQPVIHISDDGRTAWARMRLFQCGGSADGSTGSWIGGIYENTAVQENGEWKFGVQDLLHTFNASYRNGWARAGGVTLRSNKKGQTQNPRDVRGGGITQGLGGAKNPLEFAKGFPPDRPIRAKQYRFPEIVEPAFHYKNPVSGRMPKEMVNKP